MIRMKAIASGLILVGALSAGATLFARQGAEEHPASAPQERAAPTEGATVVMTYSVGDLVHENKEFPTVDDLPVGEDGVVHPSVVFSMRPLMELIAASVAPGTWKDFDSNRRARDGANGVGSITPFPHNRSLIIRHTADVHRQIQERLRQIRRVVRPGSIEVEELRNKPVEGDTAPVAPSREPDMEQRLRAVELKLDRILDVLDDRVSSRGR